MRARSRRAASVSAASRSSCALSSLEPILQATLLPGRSVPPHGGAGAHRLDLEHGRDPAEKAEKLAGNALAH